MIKAKEKKSWIIVLTIIILLLILCSCGTDSSMKQTTSTAFMVRPANFSYNEQTASSNAFQKNSNDVMVNEKATAEFDNYVKTLRENKIEVLEAQDSLTPRTPDSIFPNNWFSSHANGSLVLYPMNNENRRLERNEEFINKIKNDYKVNKIIDLTHYESEGLFLEGTGSMVLDRKNKIVYACRSPRTSEVVLNDFCKQLGYTSVVFDAKDKDGVQIYHTNVMMTIGDDMAIVCMDSISNDEQRQMLRNSLESHGKKIIEISFNQMNNFAGNMLEMKNTDGERILIMSDTAYNSLEKDQIDELSSHCKILHVNINTIEINGGGSARCMIAEIFN